MIVTLHTQGLQTLAPIRALVEGNEPVSFTLTDRHAAYGWMADTLRHFSYVRGNRADRGTLRQYLTKVTGFSRAQVTRCITQFVACGNIQDRRHAPAVPFKRHYTAEDIRLLAQVDALHGTLSGSITRKLCERAFKVHGEARFERLAGISNGHLYNLRQSTPYLRQRRAVEKTRPTRSWIGERRKPHPMGQPGFLRIDTVHQGDWDKPKGVYHINAVDEVTQFQVVCTVEKISEQYLIPALEQLLAAFPFLIRGFHSDNGSEYINGRVAALLGKLLIELMLSLLNR